MWRPVRQQYVRRHLVDHLSKRKYEWKQKLTAFMVDETLKRIEPNILVSHLVSLMLSFFFFLHHKQSSHSLSSASSQFCELVYSVNDTPTSVWVTHALFPHYPVPLHTKRTLVYLCSLALKFCRFIHPSRRDLKMYDCERWIRIWLPFSFYISNEIEESVRESNRRNFTAWTSGANWIFRVTYFKVERQWHTLNARNAAFERWKRTGQMVHR